MKRAFKISVIVILLVASIFMATAVLAQTTVYTAVIDTGALNVRQGPGINYASTTIAYKGQTVTLLGRNDNSSWAKIRTLSGQEGWVNVSYIIPNNVAISSLPLMTSSAPPLPTPLAPVTPGGVAVRSGPGFNFPAAGYVNNGSFINLLGRNGDATWVKVSANNNTLVGWMNASVIETTQSIHSLPIVDGTTPQPTTPAGAASATITTGSLNVRSGPGMGYNVLGQVHLGEVVTLLGRNSEGTWVKIPTYGGLNEGWISVAYIRANVAINNLPVLSTSTPATPAPTTPTSSTGVVNTTVANVRQGPGLAYTVITTVRFGTTVTLIGRNSANTWLHVRLANGTQGWINAPLLNINVGLNTLPITG